MQRLFLLLLLIISFPLAANVSEMKLANGLKVIVKEDHRAPVAVVMVWYRVGSADEVSGKTGLSHALEHMMFKGTNKVPMGQFSKTVAGVGGEENAFTNTDYTAYFEQISADKLETMIKLEADRMRDLQFDEQEFAKEIKVIQEERRMRTDDNPQGLTYERFMAAANLSSPYHHPIIGWMSDLQEMKLNDLRDWYERYYAPNNATLVVVGDVQAKQVFALAKQYFGQIKPSQMSLTKKQPEPPQLGKKLVEVHLPAKVPLLMVGFSVPSLNTTTHVNDVYALELIEGILDAGNSARLAKNMQRKLQVAADIDVSYNPFARYDTQFIFFAIPAQGQTVDKLDKAIWSEIDDLKNNPVSDVELKRIKTLLLASKVFEKDSIFGQAMEIGWLETVGLGWQTSDQWQEQIEKVTPAQIQQVAQRYFNSNRLTRAELIPTQDQGGNQ
ncbi:M16 family metallopeptidase [Legionella sp. W05-934-2]|jgi:zinc protease|uniref:M16 family metallopeptidase n=1 Tax=Legionella sp. W05-934-2 TaxID=1198649 RepID=UPI0034625969